MNKIKQYYYHLKIKDKLLIAFLTVAILPMIMFMLFFSSRIYNMIVADTIQKQQNASLSAGPKLNAIIENVINECNYIQSSNNYENMLSHDTKESFNYYKKSSDGQSFLSGLSLNNNTSVVTAIHIYTNLSDSHPVFQDSDYSKYIHPVSDITRTYWYGIFQGTNKIQLHCPEFYLSDYEINNYGNVAYITKSYTMYHNEPITIYTAVFYSTDSFMEILTSTTPLSGSVAYLLNPRDNIVASTDPALSSTYAFSYNTVLEESGSSNNFISKEILGSTVYAGYYRLEYSNWFLVVAIPSAPLVKLSQSLMVRIILLYLIVLVLASILTINISRSITHRLSIVSDKMLTARTGVPQPVELSEYHDEIGSLAETYNYMSGKIQQLLEDQLKSAERMRITELNALQAQINPHFLYNTMEMINWLALDGQREQVTNAIQMLSRFYKLTISKQGKTNLLQDELEHVETYVNLQNMRFNNSVELITDIPDELLDYEMPKLILQPIVENSILHGIMEKEQKSGCIVISAWQTSEETIILACDDGIGMTQEQLSRILLGQGESGKGTNIAIYNTHERIKLFYGEKYGLFYTSNYGEGTKVEIHLPLLAGSYSASEDND